MTEAAQVTETEQTQPASLTPEELAAQKEAKRQAEEAERREQEETEKKPWFKKRFDELTRQKYEHQQRADEAVNKARELEERLKRLEAQQQEHRPPQQQFSDGRPQLQDYLDKFYDQDQARESYHEALADWKFDQREKQAEQKRQQEQEQQKRDQEAQSFEQKRVATIAAGETTHDDWKETVFSIPTQIMTRQLAEATFALDNPAEAQYYLGKNLQEAERISKLSPYAMAAELGKIEAKISTHSKKTTTAPPPLNPITGAPALSGEIDPEKDPEGWIKARNEGRI